MTPCGSNGTANFHPVSSTMRLARSIATSKAVCERAASPSTVAKSTRVVRGTWCGTNGGGGGGGGGDGGGKPWGRDGGSCSCSSSGLLGKALR
eukprot:CAMPEP_0119304148 /NCGR_PEP_ID=MMETSP1333-20130426/5442_1 /TAXON_ID=418940 /ORGANISM="Scyphosphaera apsteinii, Strain RCC1455" /LENGTH=92 /DNA_ID=CAMNT_0007306977 /DNA_START=492 /DNA_END=770 /DNA_ORIENTATION=+